MASAALQQLEDLLHARRFGGTLALPGSTSRPRRATGDAHIDAITGGGWPCGALSAVSGAPSSGRTAVLWSSLITTGETDVVALVDTLDRFDPRAAVEHGVDLNRVLWVRGATLTPELARPVTMTDTVRRAVRAFDLILRAGGFAVAALDLADVPARVLRDLTPATWLRLGQANESQQTAGLVVADIPIGRSAWGVAIEITGAQVWTGTTAQSRRFAGFSMH